MPGPSAFSVQLDAAAAAASCEAIRAHGFEAPGLDTTRIAASDPRLWAAILVGNAGPVADLLAAAGWPSASPQSAALIVGHQPTLGRVAARLLSGQDAEWSVRKGALWWLSAHMRNDEPQTTLRASLTPELAD